MFIALGIVFVCIIKKHATVFRPHWIISKEQVFAYTKEFYQYSHPLFVYAVVGFFTGMLDRWLLQKFAGSVQQGFFGFSLQISAVCLLFTNAMALLITREFSIAFQEKDIKHMAHLFRRYIPMLYAVTAFIACFTAIQADKVIHIFGGNKFQEATTPVAVMAFYPILQTYGQLSGSVFYATGQTALLRNIGITFMIIGLPFTYFFIAPKTLFGLDAGATGLAIKTITLAFIAINVQLYFNTRFLKIAFIRLLWHQIYSLFLLLLLAKILIYLTDTFIQNIVTSFFVSGMLYTIGACVLLFLVPSIFSSTHEQIKQYRIRFFDFVKKKIYTS